MDQLNKRIEAKDSMALHQVGCFYDEGGLGLRQNYKMAMDYWLRAIKIGPASSLGSTRAHCSIAEAYEHGEGVVKDMNKAIYHYSLAAMGGNEQARFNLGAFYCKDGDTKKGMMHFAVAARAGDDDCMKEFQRGYISFSGHVANDEYADTMRAYKESKEEMRSEQRYIVATREAMTMGRVH
jgi:TPR repeat protein